MHLTLPNIREVEDLILAGIYCEMSYAADATSTLWQSFIPLVKDLLNRVGTDFYSVQFFPSGFFEDFNPQRKFTKWAAVKVEDTGSLPEGIFKTKVPAGKYAVFTHIGGPAAAPETFRYIFQQWLPTSGYQLDQRPHFELLGPKYKNGDPNSEEEIWIPIT